MKTIITFLRVTMLFSVTVVSLMGCGGSGSSTNGNVVAPGGTAEIILLHHSTGENIWNGGVPQWFEQHAAQYRIVEQWFPAAADGNYPYDYWNIWVNRGGQDAPLETLTANYKLISFKHCFPVSEIEADTGNPDIASDEKRLENYLLQYNALKAKLRTFPNNLFLVWTGAVQVQNAISEESAQRTRTFFDWVKTQWDEPGDNIFLWDFYELETAGGLYLRPEYAAGPDDAHPNDSFAQMAAPLLAQRLVNVLEGRGDSSSLTGR